MDRIEQLELMVAELKAEIRFLKTQAWGSRGPSYSQTENPCSEIIHTIPVESSYREEQQRWRDAGWNAYNCDMVDEFPSW